MTTDLDLTQFNYDLPTELIAQAPATHRTDSRLLHLDSGGRLHDRLFTDLHQLLRPHDILIFNDTQVIKARLNGHKESGGRVEVLIERITDSHSALAHIKASKSPKPGSRLLLEPNIDVSVTGREGELFQLSFTAPVLDLLQQYGSTPLPPYITHAAESHDEQRYQTVYAREPGAVAAPTAGLHFDDATLQQLSTLGVSQAFVTLHVGAGTFQPVRTQKLSEHVMHAERWTVPATTLQAIDQARRAGGRVVAVGTTSIRALESAAASRATANSGTLQGDTRLFITPGYQFSLVDALITNFHLPQSTLLMLVSALAGTGPIQRAYAHAVQSRYRFFSYGDAMFIEKPLQ